MTFTTQILRFLSTWSYVNSQIKAISMEPIHFIIDRNEFNCVHPNQKLNNQPVYSKYVPKLNKVR